MKNFHYHMPVDLFFGEGQIQQLAPQMKRFGNKVLLVYGGGSIKRNGIYQQIMDIFAQEGISHWELSGVEPNPRLETVIRGVELCRAHNIDLILAVGGGSSIDCAKVVAGSAHYDGNPWDIVLDSSLVKVRCHWALSSSYRLPVLKWIQWLLSPTPKPT